MGHPAARTVDSLTILIGWLLPLPPCFSKVIDFAGDEVVCFVSVLDVLKMKGLCEGIFWEGRVTIE